MNTNFLKYNSFWRWAGPRSHILFLSGPPFVCKFIHLKDNLSLLTPGPQARKGRMYVNVKLYKSKKEGTLLSGTIPRAVSNVLISISCLFMYPIL
jgi:hypothetical protein